MNKLICFIIYLSLCNCSNLISITDNHHANEAIFNTLIKNEVDLLSEEYVSNETLCFFSLSPNYVINLISEPKKFFKQTISNNNFRSFDYSLNITVKNLFGGSTHGISPEHGRLAYNLEDLSQISYRWKDEVIRRNILNDCKKSLAKSFYVALNDYNPYEETGIKFKEKYIKILDKNFFSSVKNYTEYTYGSKKDTKKIDENKINNTDKKSILTKITEKKKEITYNDSEPPVLSKINYEVLEKKGIITGQAKDNNALAELIINNQNINFSNNGNFQYSTFVPPEGIDVVIELTDTAGLTVKKTITLYRNEIKQEKSYKFTKLNPLNLKGNKNKNALALIIGIGNYENAPEAKYADRDANYFADFSENVLGVGKDNIKSISNAKASQTGIKKALKIWLKGYSAPNQSDIYIFFAGHGLASNDGKDLYLLPYDGEPRLLKDTALLRSEIFDTVKNMQPKSVTVFLDTCYSGQTREKDMILADARPIAIVPIESDVPENFTVFSASSGSEISGSLPEADHGLFSYFLMKGLEGAADANNDKKITNGELHSYVHSNVTRQAIRLGREQTPELKGDLDRVLVEFN